MSKEIKREILEKIKQYDKIIIVRHVRPDGDCVGASLGLKKILKDSFVDKKVYVIANDFADYLSFLGKEDEEVSPDKYKDALIIVLDTSNKERVSNKYFMLGKELIKIDHHVGGEEYGTINWVEDQRSSVCEMIVSFWYEFKDELKLSKEAAKALFVGIVTDSGRFKFSSVSGETMRNVGELLDIGLDVESIYSSLYLKEFKEFQIQGAVIQKTRFTPNGVAFVYIDKRMQKKYHLSSEEASAMISTMDSIKGSIMWIAFIDNNDGSIRVRLRARYMNVLSIATKYNGGGHERAAGAKVNNKKEMRQLLADADILIKENKDINVQWE